MERKHGGMAHDGIDISGRGAFEDESLITGCSVPHSFPVTALDDYVCHAHFQRRLSFSVGLSAWRTGSASVVSGWFSHCGPQNRGVGMRM